MLLFGQILALLAVVALAPVALSAFYYFTLAFHALLPRRLGKSRGTEDTARFAVLVYARNAERGIAATVKRLIEGLDYDKSKFEVVVVADACADSTAYLASFYGAKVLERRSEWKTGPAFALEWALPRLWKDGYDAVLALDADSLPLSNALKVCADAISAGYRAARLPLVSIAERSLTAEVAVASANRVNLAGRSNAGFCCGLSFPGFCLTAGVARDIPFVADTADDISLYEFQIILNDEPVAFLNDTAVFVETPAEKTVIETSAFRSPGALLKASCAGNPSAFERLIAALALKPHTVFAALLVELPTGLVLSEAASRFSSLASLAVYGRWIVIASLVSLGFASFHAAASIFACHSDSILRRAAGNIRGVL